MRAGDRELRPLRDRGRDILGGSLEMDEWEVAVMHRTHHGECCRVSWLQGDVEAMTETFRVGILPELEQTPGFCSASLLVNRATGLGCGTTVWESGAAMEASRAVGRRPAPAHRRRVRRRDRGGPRVRARLRPPAPARDGLIRAGPADPGGRPLGAAGPRREGAAFRLSPRAHDTGGRVGARWAS